ncbi:MAG TPA: DeoR/GlpR family DNA-binding transcription regulator [Pseudogracilibacillus sp.]|nr:DeoR/GlpR family DNA-binding transcription regulator [Pseudogracilibacillus sp.]
MGPEHRRNWIVEQITLEGELKIDKLVEALNVSSMTVRRDLDLLEKEGKVIRTHGGAILAKPLMIETPFMKKKSEKIDQKQKIAQKAMTRVHEGQIILLDSGTTTLEIARLLKERENITILTNDIYIAAELVDSSLEVIVLGGHLQSQVGALFGPQANSFLENIHVDVFFLGTQAIDHKAGVTSPTLEKAHLKRLMMQAAENVWLVSDSSKIGKKAFAKICDVSELTGFIIDDEMSDETKRILSQLTVIV